MPDATLPAQFAETLATQAADAILYADAEGVIRFWNAAATRIFGFTEAEALGQSLDLIIPERQRAVHWQGWARVVGGAPSRYGSGDLLAVPALAKDGKRLSIEFTILPFAAEDGRVLGIAAILRDVTQRFEETKALRREIAALKGKPG